MSVWKLRSHLGSFIPRYNDHKLFVQRLSNVELIKGRKQFIYSADYIVFHLFSAAAEFIWLLHSS